MLFLLLDGSYDRWLLKNQNWHHEDVKGKDLDPDSNSENDSCGEDL